MARKSIEERLAQLDAQRAANEASLAYARNRGARLQASIDLFKALGGGWQETQVGQ